jgi:hypothetical protein
VIEYAHCMTSLSQAISRNKRYRLSNHGSGARVRRI